MLPGVLWFLPKKMRAHFLHFCIMLHIAHVMASERIIVHSRLHSEFLHFARVCISLHLHFLHFARVCISLHLHLLHFARVCISLHLHFVHFARVCISLHYAFGGQLHFSCAFSAFFAFGGKLH